MGVLGHAACCIMASEDEEAPPELVDTSLDPVATRTTWSDRQVPVTVVCGFLGAGKTTLLSRVVTESDPSSESGLRVAYVTNEFGDTGGLESALIGLGAKPERATIGGTGVVELRNGCVCCSVKDELVQTIENLVVEAVPALDAVVLELSGAANPGPVAASFWLDPALEANVILDGVVCVVDASTALTTLAAHGGLGGDEARRQVALADVVILNKADLARDMPAVRRLAADLNPTARLGTAVRGCGDFPIRGFLLDAGYYSRRAKDVLLAAPGGAWSKPRAHSTPFASMRLDVPTHWGPAQPALLNSFLADLLSTDQDQDQDQTGTQRRHDDPDLHQTIFRVKGILPVLNSFHDNAHSLAIVQAVYDTFEVTPAPTDDLQLSQLKPFLVLIGIYLDEAAIAAAFQLCFCCNDQLGKEARAGGGGDVAS